MFFCPLKLCLFLSMQFLPLSSTPYGNAVPPADAHVPVAPATEDEVNPSASLNEWILPGFPSSQEIEVVLFFT
jgi:hypothetical protein